jgi:arylsulfatase A
LTGRKIAQDKKFFYIFIPLIEIKIPIMRICKLTLQRNPADFPMLLSTISILSLAIVFNSCTKEFKTVPSLPAQSYSNSLAARKTNIIVINADDIGFEVPTYSGGQSYSTPNMDFLAKHGVQFSQARAVPLCSPSRTELMTGKYNFRNYVGWAQLGLDERTFVNDLQDAGYKTCLAGKWDLGGGHVSIVGHGFDTYITSDPFTQFTDSADKTQHYKSPRLYTNGAFLPDSLTKGKYGDDMVRDFMFNFLDSNKNKPFFVYWATDLVHAPFCPTPDDADFAAWDPLQKERLRDTMYFPSMIKYTDKLIGQLLDKLDSINLSRNTIIVFTADNGTHPKIHSLWNNQVVQGGKGKTLETGVRVPLIVYWKGHVAPSISNNLVDVCDVYPTICDLAGIPYPSSGRDGISFAPKILGTTGPKRGWSFCYFDSRPGLDDKDPVQWAQNSSYKRYDSILNPLTTGFYNIKKYMLEKKPRPYNKMNEGQRSVDSLFESVLSAMRAEQ